MGDKGQKDKDKATKQKKAAKQKKKQQSWCRLHLKGTLSAPDTKILTPL